MRNRITIRSGGQTGVDRAALEFAVRTGLPYAGWCPRGGWAEDLPKPPGLLALYPHLTETPSSEPEQRTAWNVRDSHATLILVPGPELVRFPGTAFTRICAELIFQRPCLVVDLREASARTVMNRLKGLSIPELVLNVAGPRESEAPGIAATATAFLQELLGDR